MRPAELRKYYVSVGTQHSYLFLFWKMFFHVKCRKEGLISLRGINCNLFLRMSEKIWLDFYYRHFYTLLIAVTFENDWATALTHGTARLESQPCLHVMWAMLMDQGSAWHISQQSSNHSQDFYNHSWGAVIMNQCSWGGKENGVSLLVFLLHNFKDKNSFVYKRTGHTVGSQRPRNLTFRGKCKGVLFPSHVWELGNGWVVDISNKRTYTFSCNLYKVYMSILWVTFEDILSFKAH